MKSKMLVQVLGRVPRQRQPQPHLLPHLHAMPEPLHGPLKRPLHAAELVVHRRDRADPG